MQDDKNCWPVCHRIDDMETARVELFDNFDSALKRFERIKKVLVGDMQTAVFLGKNHIVKDDEYEYICYTDYDDDYYRPPLNFVKMERLKISE